MKKILLTLLLVEVFIAPSYAQGKSNFTPSTRLKCHILSTPKGQSAENFTLPFSRIEVADVRHDTSILGFYRVKVILSTQKYCTKNGVRQELQDYFNNYYKNNLDSSSANRLLICIKKLWMTDFDKAELTNNQRVGMLEYLYYKADVYYQVGDNYYPLQRFDSVFTQMRSSPREKWEFLQEAFQYTMQQISQVDFAAMTKKRFVERHRIDSFYSSFALPILKDTGFKKGVFATFEDFKNNRPTYDSFELKLGKLSDILYVQEADGKVYVKRDAWGFCDGTNYYVRMGLNYFPIYRINQTWEFYGSNIVREKASVGGGFWGSMPLAYAMATEAVHSTRSETYFTRTKLRPYHIDMDTGEIY